MFKAFFNCIFTHFPFRIGVDTEPLVEDYDGIFLGLMLYRQVSQYEKVRSNMVCSFCGQVLITALISGYYIEKKKSSCASRSHFEQVFGMGGGGLNHYFRGIIKKNIN